MKHLPNKIYFFTCKSIFEMLFRIEKDKGKIMAEVADMRAATDEVNRSKVMNIICPKI